MYTAIIEKCHDTDLFVGYVPSFPGAHSQGATLDELLIASGFVRDPTEYADPEVKEWLALPEAERVRIISETDSLYLSDSPASRAVIENRS